MKLSEIEQVSKRLQDGYKFRVFPGTDIIATVVPIDVNKQELNITKEWANYFYKNPDKKNIEDISFEDIDKVKAYALFETCIIKVEGIKDDKDEEVEWSREVIEEIIEKGTFKEFIERIFSFVENISLGDMAYKVDDNTKKKF